MAISGNAYDPDIIRCPWQFDAQLRNEAPVHYDADNDIYLVSGYDLMTSVIQDTTNFSSQYMAKMVGKEPFPPEVMQIYMRGYPMVDALLVTDGDQHNRHRKIITKAFSKKRLMELTPLFEQRVANLFSNALHDGRMAFRADFADLVPLIMTEQQLRVADGEMDQLVAWSHILSSGFGGSAKSLERLKFEAEQTLLFQQYFEKRLSHEMQRIESTGQGEREDDLLTLLAQAILNPDDPMDMKEAISFLFILLPATHDTTSAAMTACMHRFVESPQAQRDARENPDFLKGLIDESMRHEAPVRQFWRLAVNEVELAGVTIPAGAWVLLRISAANRDDAVFAEADRFDPRRKLARPYLTFGTGIHTCAGRQWALHIIGIALRHFAASGKTFSFIEGENDFDHEVNLLSAPFSELMIAIQDQ